MLTQKDYCDYETCVALKEFGLNNAAEARLSISAKVFDLKPEPYIELSPKILLYEAQKWMREEKGLHIEITYSPSCWTGKIYDLKEWDYIKGFTFFESFEETLHILIKEAVKILKEEK